jgi:hypothetical protein
LAELRTPEAKDVAELSERMRRDYQVQLAELVLVANLKAAHVTISVIGGDERAALLASHLQRLWDSSLTGMTAAIGDGRVAYEKIWDYDPDANLSHIRKLEPLPFRLTSMRLTEQGEFNGIDLTARPEPLSIPPEKSWWLALDPTAGEPHGRSRYVGAPHEVWKERREAIRLRKLFLKRFAVRAGVAHIPPTVEDERGQLIDNFEATGKAIDELLAGGMLLFPNTRDPQGNYEYDYTDPPSTLDPSPIDTVIDGLDAEQLRAFGVPEKTVIEGQAVGSFAMVSQQMLILYAVVEGLLSQFVDSFQKYIIDKVVEANYCRLTAPRITASYIPLTQQPNSLLADLVRSILTAPQLSPLVASGAIDLPQMLEDAGIPVTADLAERLRELLTPQSPSTAEMALAWEDEPIWDLAGCKNTHKGFADGNKCAAKRKNPNRVAAGKKSAVPATKEKHVAATKLEKYTAQILHGKHVGKQAPIDVMVPQTRLHISPPVTSARGQRKFKRSRHNLGPAPVKATRSQKKWLHGIEVKGLFAGRHHTIRIKKRARERKGDWEAVGDRIMHLLVHDERKTFQNGKYAHLYSGHRMYYRRGFQSGHLSEMHQVQNVTHLRRLIAMTDRQLAKEWQDQAKNRKKIP